MADARRARWLAVATLVALASLIPHDAILYEGTAGPASPSPSTAPTLSTVSIDRLGRLDSPLRPVIDPELRAVQAPVPVVVAVDARTPVAELAGALEAAQYTPPIGGVRLGRGLAGADGLASLEARPDVFAIARDVPLRPSDLPMRDASVWRQGLRDAREAMRFRPDFPSFSPRGGPEVSMRDVVNFTGARAAWEQLGLTGVGVTIAVVDTGVDFGAFTLGDAALARDEKGFPASFDPDGGTIALTNNTPAVAPTMPNRTFLMTLGADPWVYLFDFGFLGPPGGRVVRWSTLWGAGFPGNMEVTGIPSMSGVYHFGVLQQWNFGFDLFPILVTDAAVAGVYDSVYVDLSFDWWLQGFNPAPQPDFNFSDEARLTPTGNAIAARHFQADPKPDVSAGVLAYVLDLFHKAPSQRGLILPPVDPAGNFVGFVYDWAGHGTFVASSAAGRETGHPRAGPGIAPGARLQGIPVFLWFDIITGWLWAAGFDLQTPGPPGGETVPNLEVTYGVWSYTGRHKADVITNSWGTSDWLSWRVPNGWPWYDVIMVLEDALTVPGYLDPAYPGTVLVHAAGNGAAGYGTVTNPAHATLPIAVGAGTSLNFSRDSFGMAGGRFHDVMSWSGRGPAPLGNVKPDVVHVGAFAYAAGPIWFGFGNGTDAWDLFGGTSQATPLAAATAAIVIQAHASAVGTRPTPEAVKVILKSSAKDLGYDPFVQGAGHVDVYRAARLALGAAGMRVESPATYAAMRPRIAGAWALDRGYYGRPELRQTPPDGPIADADWFAGAPAPGNSTSATFTLRGTASAQSGTVRAVRHVRTFNTTLTAVTRAGIGFLEGYGAFFTLPAIPATADLMVVRGIIPYSFFDADGNSVWDNRSRVFVMDWSDANGNAVVEPAETTLINYGYNAGTTVEARVGVPRSKFAATPIALLGHVPIQTFVSMPVRLQVEFYERAVWPWLAVPGTFSVPAGGNATVTATLTVPANATQGVVEGQILFATSGPAGETVAVPVSAAVYATAGPGVRSVPLTPAAAPRELYDPYRVNGHFDWRWRYESGDWKVWFLEVQDPNVIAARVTASWTGPRTDVDLFSVRPDGVVTDSSFSPYLGSGIFQRSTRTGGAADYVTLGVSGGAQPALTGLYTILLHNVLLDGANVPEDIVGTAQLVYLSPRGPVTLPARPGEVVRQTFVLSTGMDLTSVLFRQITPPGSSNLTAVTDPAFVDRIAANTERQLNVSIAVPAGTTDGTYPVFLAVAPSEIPATLVRIDVVVDASPPRVTVVAPAPGAFLRAVVPVRARVNETGNLSAVEVSTGGPFQPMVFDTGSGLWVADVDTRTRADGPANLTVRATDQAGNVAAAQVGVVLDNTPPVVAFSSPATGSVVAGTVSIRFNATDANLDRAELVVDGIVGNVTGQTSYLVNTSAIPDRALTAVLLAVDRAGNRAQTSLSFVVDNTKPVALVTAPGESAWARGALTVQFLATDVHLTRLRLSFDGREVDVMGSSSYALDTATLGDGTRTLTLIATDAAGNGAIATRTLQVDNTPPVPSLTAPANGSVVRGVVRFAFSASDANLERATLVIDGVAVDVTSASSYDWDSTRTGDNRYRVSLTAVDRAGNERTVWIELTTDNFESARREVANQFLLLGLAVGLAAGAALVVGVFWWRRRRKAGAESEPPTAP